ncbi:hypothetical protein PFISCL1PPCAC_4189, partial [Pristionchus fissidentatus]
MRTTTTVPSKLDQVIDDPTVLLDSAHFRFLLCFSRLSHFHVLSRFRHLHLLIVIITFFLIFILFVRRRLLLALLLVHRDRRRLRAHLILEQRPSVVPAQSLVQRQLGCRDVVRAVVGTTYHLDHIRVWREVPPSAVDQVQMELAERDLVPTTARGLIRAQQLGYGWGRGRDLSGSRYLGRALSLGPGRYCSRRRRGCSRCNRRRSSCGRRDRGGRGCSRLRRRLNRLGRKCGRERATRRRRIRARRRPRRRVSERCAIGGRRAAAVCTTILLERGREAASGRRVGHRSSTS